MNKIFTGKNPLLCFVIFSSIILAISNYFFSFNFDVALHFFHSIRMVEQGGLYTRWVEVMPPTIYLIYALPVYVHKITGLSYVFCLNFFVNLLSLVSVLLINNSLKRGNVDNGTRINFITAALIIFFIIPYLNLAQNDRDTLFLVLCYPWIMNRILKLRSGLPVLVLAVIGFSIKQYNCLYPLAIILLGENFDRDYFRRIFSRENIILGTLMAGLQIIYFICFREYYTEILPVLLVAYKGYYPPSTWLLLVSGFVFLFIFFYFMKLKISKNVLRIFLIIFAVTLVIITLNGNVRYNLNHTYAIAAIAIFYVISIHPKAETRYTISLFVCMVITMSLLMQGLAVKKVLISDRADEHYDKCHQKLTEYTKHPYIFLDVMRWGFMQDYTNSDRLYYENTNHMMALDHFWMMPWLYNNKDKPEATKIKDYIRKNIEDALARDDNPYIINDISPQHESLPEGFDILNFLKNDVGLAKELQDFRKIDYISECQIEIWKKP